MTVVIARILTFQRALNDFMGFPPLSFVSPRMTDFKQKMTDLGQGGLSNMTNIVDAAKGVGLGSYQKASLVNRSVSLPTFVLGARTCWFRRVHLVALSSDFRTEWDFQSLENLHHRPSSSSQVVGRCTAVGLE